MSDISMPKNDYKHVFGANPKILARRNDPDTSHEAAQSIDSTTLERMVYEAILSFGSRGCISDEVRAMYPWLPYSSVTARYKSLLDKKYITDTGARRAGKSGKNQRVLIANTTRSLENAIRQQTATV